MGLRGPGLTPLHGVQQHLLGLRGGGPVVRVLAEQRRDHGPERTGVDGGGRLVGDDGLHGGDRGRTAERGGPLDRRVQRGAQRPEVGGGAGIAAAYPFGGQVVDGADQFAGPGDGGVALDRGDPEVGEEHLPVAGEQDVARLDVAVQHPGAVGGAQGAQYVESDAGRLARGDLAALLGGVGERGPVDVLHDDPRALVVLDDVVDGDDPGVRDARRRPRLLLRPGVQDEPVGLGDVQPGGQLLDGDGAVQHLVVGPPDLAHAAPAEHVAQPVAPRQHQSRVRAV